MISNPIGTSRAWLCALTSITVLHGCAARPVVDTQAADPCVVSDAAPDSVIRFAVRPDAAADFVAAQLYDTLVRVDCTGAAQPGLAWRWSDSAAIEWRFEVRGGAEFQNGGSANAQAVLRSWTSPARSMATSFAALSAHGANILLAVLHEPARVHLFADPELSVVDFDEVPAGTTRWIVAAAQEPTVLLSHDSRILTVDTYGDLKAALNDGVHGLVSDDPDIIAYARTRPEYRTTPLPWTRTHVIATARARPSARLPQEVLETFARDVVGGAVRAAEPPFWWESASCGPPGTPFASRAARDIVYPRGDRVAQAIAERIAALAWPAAAAPAWVRDLLPAAYGSTGAPRVQPLDEAALLTAIRARLPLAVVAPLPVMFDRICVRSAPESTGRALLSSGWQLTPVLDARALLIHRPGLGATIDGFGRIRIEP